jgi:hypothetical protein
MGQPSKLEKLNWKIHLGQVDVFAVKFSFAASQFLKEILKIRQGKFGRNGPAGYDTCRALK